MLTDKQKLAQYSMIIEECTEEIGRLQEENKELSALARGLRAYGMIKTVTRVVYSEGSHEELMEKVDILTN